MNELMNGLLNEEAYEKANRKVKVIGLIIMVLGLLLVAGGIYYLYTSSTMKLPEFGDSTYYTVRTEQMHIKSSGLFMLLPGIFLTIVGIMVRFVMGNQRKIMAYQMQQMIPVVKESAREMAPELKKLAEDMKDIKNDLDTW